jgi:hypothetical protein
VCCQQLFLVFLRLKLQCGLKITYDISEHQSNEEFNVWIEITDSNGKTLIYRTVNGDIGEHVSGGDDKEITWNYASDGINLEVGINIQVFGQPMGSPDIQKPVESNAIDRELNKTSLVLQSLVIPGLGLSRATGKPHWLKGVAGYACLGSAIAFNRMAVNSFSAYLEESDIPTREDLFDKSITQDQISEVFAYTAAAIWITDIIWTLVGVSNLYRAADGKGLSINSYYESTVQAPMLALRYRF